MSAESYKSYDCFVHLHCSFLVQQSDSLVPLQPGRIQTQYPRKETKPWDRIMFCTDFWNHWNNKEECRMHFSSLLQPLAGWRPSIVRWDIMEPSLKAKNELGLCLWCHGWYHHLNCCLKGIGLYICYPLELVLVLRNNTYSNVCSGICFAARAHKGAFLQPSFPFLASGDGQEFWLSPSSCFSASSRQCPAQSEVLSPQVTLRVRTTCATICLSASILGPKHPPQCFFSPTVSLFTRGVSQMLSYITRSLQKHFLISCTDREIWRGNLEKTVWRHSTKKWENT